MWRDLYRQTEWRRVIEKWPSAPLGLQPCSSRCHATSFDVREIWADTPSLPSTWETRFISFHPVYDLVVLEEKMKKGWFRWQKFTKAEIVLATSSLYKKACHHPCRFCEYRRRLWRSIEWAYWNKLQRGCPHIYVGLLLSGVLPAHYSNMPNSILSRSYL